jgi:hypothetical protein
VHNNNALSGHPAVGYSQIVRDFAGILHMEEGQVRVIVNLEGFAVVSAGELDIEDLPVIDAHLEV